MTISDDRKFQSGPGRIARLFIDRCGFQQERYVFYLREAANKADDDVVFAGIDKSAQRIAILAATRKKFQIQSKRDDLELIAAADAESPAYFFQLLVRNNHYSICRETG